MSWKLIVLIVYIVLNLVAAFLYVSDKKKAIEKEWRIPEKTLLIAAFFGPFGAAIAMKLAHHKTQKTKFKLVYLFLILHIALIAAIVLIK